MDDTFIGFCKIGNLNGIKNLINLHKIRQNRNLIYAKINIHADDEEGFRWACSDGHKHIVEYLIKLHKTEPFYAKINIHAHNELGFTWARKYGHKHLVKYLLSCGCYSNNYKCIIIL
jgi:hypothetical protein